MIAYFGNRHAPLCRVAIEELSGKVCQVGPNESAMPWSWEMEGVTLNIAQLAVA
jgi:hypothetical protein